jgi:hypothetical protein
MNHEKEINSRVTMPWKTNYMSFLKNKGKYLRKIDSH